MTDRVLDISEGGCRLKVENRQLVIEREGAEKRTVPMADIGILIVSNAWTTYTHSVLSLLAECGGVLVVCDPRSLPVAMSLPFYGHSLQSQRLNQQIEASQPCRKRTWQRLITAKVRNQAAALQKARGDDAGLFALADTVRSGDPENIEAQAARIYWHRIFADESFRREPQSGNPPNLFLDYGYSVLRAIFARAICGAALNPTLGVHHHNRDSSFCLADDLMEPLRPLVDFKVVEMMNSGRAGVLLNRETKSWIMGGLVGRVSFDGQRRTVFDCALRMAASVAAVFAGEVDELALPDDLDFLLD